MRVPGDAGRERPCLQAGPGLVIPDTCMDLIFSFDPVRNEEADLFSGINDRVFELHPENLPALRIDFGIRLYFWAVPLFTEMSLCQALNADVPVEAHFGQLGRELREAVRQAETLSGRARLAQRILLKHLHADRKNNTVMNAAYRILSGKGALDIPEAAQYASVSQRQLERLFHSQIGVSPKKLAGLVRYQSLWNDVIRNPELPIQTAVESYGYSDQSHLLNDFRKYHGMTPGQARLMAMPTG